MPDTEPLAPPRCDAARRRAVMAAAQALGVPVDHGRRWGLRPVAEPAALAFIGHDIHGRPQWLAPRAARAWARMRDAALHDGIELQPVSAFRSAEYQLVILERKLARGLSIAEILQVNAAPGYSEHHSGRAIDLTTPDYAPLEEEFEDSPAFAWLARRAGEFGYTLSYPHDNARGIAYEPWHWCWRLGRS